MYRTSSRSFLKLGTPNPVVGSQPLVAFQKAPGMTPAYTELALIPRDLVQKKKKGYTYARKRASRLSVIAVAADRLTTGDIGESPVGISVNQRIQESKSGQAFTETCIVQEGNNTSHDGSGCRSTTAGSELAALEHGITFQKWLVAVKDSI